MSEETPNTGSGKPMLPNEPKSAIVACLLSLFCLGGIGQLYLGQTKKGIILIVATLILAPTGIGIIAPIIGAYEGYVIGQKLENGESVEQDEWAIGFLNDMLNK